VIEGKSDVCAVTAASMLAELKITYRIFRTFGIDGFFIE